MTYSAILFDLCDTLLYCTGTGTREDAIELIRAHGMAEDDWLRGWRDGLEASLKGDISLWQRVRRALKMAGHGSVDLALVDEIASLLAVRQLPRVYPDVRSSLSELRRIGYSLGLVSNLQPDEVGWLNSLELASLQGLCTLTAQKKCR